MIDKVKMALELYPIEKELAKERQEATHVKGIKKAVTLANELDGVGKSIDLAAEQAGISGIIFLYLQYVLSLQPFRDVATSVNLKSQI